MEARLGRYRRADARGHRSGPRDPPGRGGRRVRRERRPSYIAPRVPRRGVVLRPGARALQLQRSGNFREALDWFRLVYDYTAPAGQRKIAAALVGDESTGSGFRRERELGVAPRPAEPASDRSDTLEHLHAVHPAVDHPLRARLRRERVHTGHAESVPRARLLFDSSLRLLDDPALAQSYRSACDAVIGELTFQYGDDYTELVAASGRDWSASLTLDTVERMVPQIREILDSPAEPARKATRSGPSSQPSASQTSGNVPEPSRSSWPRRRRPTPTPST